MYQRKLSRHEKKAEITCCAWPGVSIKLGSLSGIFSLSRLNMFRGKSSPPAAHEKDPSVRRGKIQWHRHMGLKVIHGRQPLPRTDETKETFR